MEKIKCLHLVWGWGVGKKEKILLIQKSFFLKTFLFIEFSDANAKFYCRLYYAGEFHKMREVILGSSEEDFIGKSLLDVNEAEALKFGKSLSVTETICDDVIFVSKKSSETGWNIVVSVDKEIVFKPVENMQRTTWTLVVLSMLILLAIYIFYAITM